jgi:hypothetical protein
MLSLRASMGRVWVSARRSRRLDGRRGRCPPRRAQHPDDGTDEPRREVHGRHAPAPEADRHGTATALDTQTAHVGRPRDGWAILVVTATDAAPPVSPVSATMAPAVPSTRAVSGSRMNSSDHAVTALGTPSAPR